MIAFLSEEKRRGTLSARFPFFRANQMRPMEGCLSDCCIFSLPKGRYRQKKQFRTLTGRGVHRVITSAAASAAARQAGFFLFDPLEAQRRLAGPLAYTLLQRQGCLTDMSAVFLLGRSDGELFRTAEWLLRRVRYVDIFCGRETEWARAFLYEHYGLAAFIPNNVPYVELCLHAVSSTFPQRQNRQGKIDLTGAYEKGNPADICAAELILPAEIEKLLPEDTDRGQTASFLLESGKCSPQAIQIGSFLTRAEANSFLTGKESAV